MKYILSSHDLPYEDNYMYYEHQLKKKNKEKERYVLLLYTSK